MSDTSYIAYTQIISDYINFYSGIIFLPFGLVFNLFSIIVFTRAQFQNNKKSFLSCWLIVIQTISLAIGFFMTYFLECIGIQFRSKTDFSCKIMLFARRVANQSASWAQTICTIESFLQVKYLNKFNLFKRKWLSLFIITILMLLLLSIINATNLFYNLGLITINNNTQIQCPASNMLILETISDTISILMRNFIPSFLMLILNILIAKDLIQSKNKFHARRTNKREFHFISSIISMNCIFFIFYTPLSVVYVVFDIYKFNSSTSATQTATVQLIYNITSVISYIYSTLPFFINLFFNKLFKNQVLVIIERFSLIFKILNSVRTKNEEKLDNINNKTRETLTTYI